MKLYTISILFLLPFIVQAQGEVTLNSMTQTELLALMESYGLDNVTNVQMECSDISWGSMTMEGEAIFGNGAVALTTGLLTNIQGPNDSESASESTNSQIMDADLEAITGFPSYDVCRLSFTITPDDDYLAFNFIFGSEEYPEYTCTNFNDAVGIFLTGSNPDGDAYAVTNVINIPGTNLPVAINSINDVDCIFDGLQCPCNDFYYGWDSATDENLQYDGFTIPMMSLVPVTAGESYEVKIVIGDSGDSAFDSGVILFLQSLADEFELVSLESFGKVDGNTAREGCGAIEVMATLPMAFDKEVTVELSFDGVAAPNTDFLADKTKFVFAPGETSDIMTIDVMEDVLVEPIEGFELKLDLFKIGVQELALDIKAEFEILDPIADENLPFITTPTVEVCLGESHEILADNGLSYHWEPASHLSSQEIANPTFTADAVGTFEYELTAHYDEYCEPASRSISITVIDCSSGITAQMAAQFQVHSTIDSGQIIMNLPDNSPSAQLSIFDSSGRLIHQENIPSQTTITSISSNQFRSGMHFAQLQFSDGTSVSRSFLL